MSDSSERAAREALPACVRAMLEPDFYPSSPPDVELVQTHISFVLLAGDEVLKLKKPVRFSFLDFSTLESRLHYCREEVRLNRRLAPEVYLGVVSICEVDGGFRLGDEDDSEAIEYAVRMKRLPADRMFSEILSRGEGSVDHIDEIARRLVDFHAEADASPEVAANGSPAALLAVLESDFSESGRYRGQTISVADDLAIQSFCTGFVNDNQGLLRSRQEKRRIRECHGDLRAEHLCFSDGLQAIDCIEFEARFRNRDVAAEVAFLAMDIEHLGHRDLARQLIERYARYSGDRDLVRLVPFYQCYFAYIRGKVESLASLEVEVGEEGRRIAAEQARGHFAQAHRYTWAYSRALIVVCGLSGTGKTTVARAVRERLGFEHFNSDVVRKQLAGVSTDRPSAPDVRGSLYSPEQSRRTYDRMLEYARDELDSGHGVIVDATFQRREHRQRFYDLALNEGVTLLLVECVCEEDEIRSRLDERARSGTGPSDADWEVYRKQRRAYEELADDESVARVVVEGSRSLSSAVARVEDALRSRIAEHRLEAESR